MHTREAEVVEAERPQLEEHLPTLTPRMQNDPLQLHDALLPIEIRSTSVALHGGAGDQPTVSAAAANNGTWDSPCSLSGLPHRRDDELGHLTYCEGGELEGGVWGVRHSGVAWELVMQHCGIAAAVTRPRLGGPPRAKGAVHRRTAGRDEGRMYGGAHR